MLPLTLAAETAETTPQEHSVVDVQKAAEQADEAVAGLSTEKKKLLATWLHLLDSAEDTDESGASVLTYAPKVPADLAQILRSTADEGKSVSFMSVLWRTVFAIGLGYLLVRGLLGLLRKRLTQFGRAAPAEDEGFSRVWMGLMDNLPRIAALLLLGIISTIIFLILAGDVGIKGRMFFQTVLGTILFFMLFALLGRILFSPGNSQVRLLNISDKLVNPLYRAFYISVGVLFSGLLIVNFVEELGAVPQTVSWVVIVLGSAVLIIYGYLIVFLKQPVADGLLEQLEKQEAGWVIKQLAGKWHVLSLIYLLLVWFFWIGKQLTGTGGRDSTFLASILIVPLFFVLNYVGRLIINASVESLGLGQISDDEFSEDADDAFKTEEREDKKRKISQRVHQVFKIVLITVLLIWFLSLWGMSIPFAGAALNAVFDSLVAVALALVAWRFASSYIARKLEEAEPEEEQKEEDVDDEFGGAAQRGRSYTLLPMLRKVTGTVLVVMVLLIVISSLGVNIAPLLAGAGVVGLAVGFGAQKLVSDVLSGFFFLLDDAFRVGEYIQAGSIKGTVEAITLRNVMLRHHRGMLQVVPHSDLGAITNYMRGGIVIKFNLEFPYDTEIDKVRKIIKKVGIAMLEDEELGDDFILPVKSQGVSEITNSVMVIRVKFTAKPGKQFVIKREAFRRITEALNAKNIYYAHRKVIVDLPEDARSDIQDGQASQQALKAGAAAASAIQAEKQQQQEKKAQE
ncbi:MAG: mechanosensitive ion channel [Desulfofustis sp.]|nr:mechanosensitive ion channel [Desulfofustis sp.]